MTRSPRLLALLATAAALVPLAACSSDGDGASGAMSDADSGTTAPAADTDGFAGVVREPAPQVDAVAVPSLSTPGTDVRFRADDGGIELVYFGFTGCPDVCPTTMADVSVALRKLEPGDADKVDVVMATFDPERDLELLDGYVKSFVPDGVAVGTADMAVLEAAAEPFGASWEQRTLEDGTVQFDHSPFLYAVDDDGTLALTWQFGTSSDELAADITKLLEQSA